MFIASIDIGSNTVLMLISEVDLEMKNFRPVKNYYRIPRLGKGLSRDQNISEEKIVELISILDKFKNEAEKFGCENIICVATNAMRVAKNKDEIIARVFESNSIKINIISGEEEASLSFLGATSSLNTSKYFVIDIGGGSTELILGTKKGIEIKKSFPIGVVSFFEKFVKEFPLGSDVVKEIKNEIYTQLKSFPLDDLTNYLAISIAGTPTTLTAIKNNLTDFDEEKIEGEILNLTEIEKLILTLQNLSPHEILERYSNVVKGREDLILIGAVILATIMERFKLVQTIVSTKGIRYGLVEDFILKLTRE